MNIDQESDTNALALIFKFRVGFYLNDIINIVILLLLFLYPYAWMMFYF